MAAVVTAVVAHITGGAAIVAVHRSPLLHRVPTETTHKALDRILLLAVIHSHGIERHGRAWRWLLLRIRIFRKGRGG